MIFVTVGTQLPFDRLAKTVDEWAGRSGRTDVFAQIASTDWRPNHIEWAQFIDPREFREKVESASVLIAHAGIGSILTALEFRKPILIMPRRAELKEHRNDHQVATAKRFEELGHVTVAYDEDELVKHLDNLDAIQAGKQVSPSASPELLQAIRNFVNDTAV